MPQYADIGKSSRDLLSGTPKSGAFNFNPKLTFSSTTSTGVSFAVTAIANTEKNVDGTLKVSYGNKCYSTDATIAPGGKTSVNATLANALDKAGVPGVKLGLSAALPDVAGTAKMNMEYNPCKEFGMKKSFTLSSAPLLDVSCGGLYMGVTSGAELSYDAAKGAVTKSNLAVGYSADDFQVSAHYIGMEANKKTNSLDALLKLAFVHKINPTKTVGAEVTRNLSNSGISFTLGYSEKLMCGALAKLKLDNTGLLSMMYETSLTTGETLAGALQMQATDLSQPPKVGLSIDLS
uniref:Voltage-dependent anion-selective channel protein n=1 Tax=Chlamydomonas euryale TaxID=1486919 RepID=A0A7R9V2N3_9CHLO|mmetsp:Transcript_11765/g.34773  ORF Transcript_11765/g.34773 Transcript_11765/m.34773 type:complete len:292 (+) Transcript_11765:67-942(+)